MIERAFDAEDHPLNESPTLIKFLPLLPMQFDTEINDNSIHNK